MEKNQPPIDSEYYGPVARSHRMLRVMEALRNDQGDGAIQPYYWALGTRIHHDNDLYFDLADVLKTVGADPTLAQAADDPSWDSEILARMNRGLELTGQDVGTPLLAIADRQGNEVGLFGPVITRVPGVEDSLALWDGFVAVATVPGFWELKRTRTEMPDFGDRPDSVAL